MDIPSLLVELYGRVPPAARQAVEGVDTDRLVTPVAPGTNTIAWLVWHIGRVQDHHVGEILGVDQIWTEGDWAAGFGLEPDPSNTGYGHSGDEVSSVRPVRAEVLLDYLDAVYERTSSMLTEITPDELDRIVDRRWDPPVSLGVRLVSIADDSLQHAGQATFVRGCLGV